MRSSKYSADTGREEQAARTETSLSSDACATHFPVSVKAVVLLEDGVPVLMNERNEWELPGGKLEIGEQPTDCVVREVSEELALSVTVNHVLASFVIHPVPSVPVVVIVYLVIPSEQSQPRRSDEHRDLRILREVDLPLPGLNSHYDAAVRKAFAIFKD